MDLKIKDTSNSFKCRVNGVLLHEGRILVLQMCHNGFYCCPGGHVHLGEKSTDAIEREFYEETKIKVKAEKLLSVMENFFLGKLGKFHEISFYYLLTPTGEFSTTDFSLIENDEGNLLDMEYRWVALDKLSDINFKPEILKKKLETKNFDFEHIIYDQISLNKSI